MPLLLQDGAGATLTIKMKLIHDKKFVKMSVNGRTRPTALRIASCFGEKYTHCHARQKSPHSGSCTIQRRKLKLAFGGDIIYHLKLVVKQLAPIH
jgi:hypothetical protein